MNKIGIWLSLSLLFGLCLSCRSNNATAPDISKTNKIIVTYDDPATARGDLPLMTIIDKNKVTSLVEYTTKHVLSGPTLKTDWCRIAKVQGRSTYLKVSFYQDGSYTGSVGIGRYSDTHFFLEFISYDFVRDSCISVKEKDDFLSILSLNNNEYGSLLKRFE